MNIIEAIKSGLPFRRIAWDISEWWIQPKAVNYLPRLRSVDILADDWEVEPTSGTITRADFDEAWSRAIDVTEKMGIMTRQYLCLLLVREFNL